MKLVLTIMIFSFVSLMPYPRRTVRAEVLPVRAIKVNSSNKHLLYAKSADEVDAYIYEKTSGLKSVEKEGKK